MFKFGNDEDEEDQPLFFFISDKIFFFNNLVLQSFNTIYHQFNLLLIIPIVFLRIANL